MSLGPRPYSLETKFWRHTMRDASCGCWVWVGCTDADGYGIIRHNGTNVRAHRASYQIHKGETPSHLAVCHSCDNPCCVNPDHLFLGDETDNNRDAVTKGRHKTGSVMNYEIAAQVRKAKEKLTGRTVAKQFGISEAAVSRITNFKRWN